MFFLSALSIRKDISTHQSCSLPSPATILFLESSKEKKQIKSKIFNRIEDFAQWADEVVEKQRLHQG